MLDTVIFRSASRSAGDERAFVLLAVGIAAEVRAVITLPTAEPFVRPGLAAARAGPAAFELLVAEQDAARALAELERYETERQAPVAITAPVPPPQRGAWIGCVIYAAVLLGVTALLARGLLRLDAFDLGQLDVGRMRAGQWWRALTALTLHLDAAHLLGNLGAGLWFGYLAGRQLGAGHAWLLIVLGAGAANAMEGLYGPADHLSVGASTAIFTALGLIAAHSWRAQRQDAQHGARRWAQRWAPLVGGAILLGLLGSGGGDGSQAPGTPDADSDQSVDLVAHALGFVIGTALGTLAAWSRCAALLARLPQWLTGSAALLAIVVAWAIALSR